MSIVTDASSFGPKATLLKILSRITEPTEGV
jgi:ABC-type polysaccharide/polyol phosphate transport system ATPase subunit